MPSRIQAKRHLVGWIGLGTAGDIGPWTCWTNKNGRFVVSRRTKPDKPPSDAQIRQRSRFALAIQNWKALTALQRATWGLLVERCSIASSPIGAYISLALNPNDAALQTQAHRANVTIAPPTPIGP